MATPSHAAAARNGLFVGLRLWFGNFFTRYGFQFSADHVSGEARTQETSIHRRHFVFADFAAKGAEFAFEALADDRGFVGFLGGVGEGGFDVAVGDSAGAEVARDAEFSLATDFRALAGELFGEALVVYHFGAFEAVHDGSKELVVFGAPAEELLHFVDGISAAHEGSHGGFV
jgi:hypothetical protein